MNNQISNPLRSERIQIGNIPAILYGENSNKIYLYVHGKLSRKEEAEELASHVVPLGYRVLSFDFPEHGERSAEKRLFNVQNCVEDLHTVFDYIDGFYRSVNLYACSIGAYFSLVAFQKFTFDKCLFVSPILDMERLIMNMMKGTGVSEEDLEERKVIETPFGETLLWDYYRYVKDHPIDRWNSQTFILYGENDNLTEREVLDCFAERFGSSVKIKIMKEGEHFFHTPPQIKFLRNWLKEIL